MQRSSGWRVALSQLILDVAQRLAVWVYWLGRSAERRAYEAAMQDVAARIVEAFTAERADMTWTNAPKGTEWKQ